MGPTPGPTKGRVSLVAPVAPLSTMPLYVLVERLAQLGLTALPGPPVTLPSVDARFRHAGLAPSHPAGAWGIWTAPLNSVEVLTPLDNCTRMTSPPAVSLLWNVSP